MKIDIISVVPQLMESFFNHSIIKRAKEKGLLEINVVNLRDYTNYKHGQVDDYQFGGGAGLVIMIEPLVNAIESLQNSTIYDEIIFLTPDGDQFTQQMANRLSLKNNLLMICGHYKGIDQRVRDHFITKEISIGDYVLSGGELAAAVITDAIGRLLPGVLNDETSALTDSFQDQLLAPPVYTRPHNFRGYEVPGVLLSGNHAKIELWRQEQANIKTNEKRPDLEQKGEKF
ncbi:tRNA (guanosine(37)-N1)-methyltransferase TrmD [soil metagenome]